ncbi:MAG TPA: nascent polypeptide-associated complex protein [Candidatus Bathyarchaeia archaeon]
MEAHDRLNKHTCLHSVDGRMMRRKISPREQQRMMQQMGMQVQQLDDVTRVIMETPSRRIVIDDPEVATVTVQGQTIYQVGGGSVKEEVVSGQASVDDAKLVASQAGVSQEEAAEALRQSGGDLAQAIVLLKQKKT